MIETSSDLLWSSLQSSVICGKCLEMFGNVRLALGIILENRWKSSERGRKSSENRQKRRYQYVYIIKGTLHVGRRWEFHALVARTISHLFAALTREILFLPLEHKIHICSPPCNIYICRPQQNNSWFALSHNPDAIKNYSQTISGWSQEIVML